MVTIDKIFHAQVALKNIIRPTPLAKAYGIAPECSLYFKPENLQNTGSFKLRGSGYMIAQLSDEEKAVLFRSQRAAGRCEAAEEKPYTGLGAAGLNG